MAAEPATPSDRFERYECCDWRSWASWRALFVSGATIGLIAAVAGLIADSFVRDLLGMGLGHSGYFAGPDILAFVLAWGVSIPGLLVWHRILKNPNDQVSEFRTLPPTLPGSKRLLGQMSLVICWFSSALLVFLLLYAGISAILAGGEVGRLNFIILSVLLIINVNSLGLVFRRFGAKLLPSDPIVQ